MHNSKKEKIAIDFLGFIDNIGCAIIKSRIWLPHTTCLNPQKAFFRNSLPFESENTRCFRSLVSRIKAAVPNLEGAEFEHAFFITGSSDEDIGKAERRYRRAAYGFWDNTGMEAVSLNFWDMG